MPSGPEELHERRILRHPFGAGPGAGVEQLDKLADTVMVAVEPGLDNGGVTKLWELHRVHQPVTGSGLSSHALQHLADAWLRPVRASSGVKLGPGGRSRLVFILLSPSLVMSRP